MAGFKGRSIAFAWGGSPIGGVREKGLTLNGEPIDVTSDEDGGWRTLLAESAQDQVDLTIAGITKSGALKDDWMAGTRTQSVTLTYPDGSILSGSFYLSNYEETGPYNDATSFTATLMSTGAVDWQAYT